MPPDLTVDAIIFPPFITAPCPLTIQVVVRNQGADKAGYPFSVCLQITTDPDLPFVPEYVKWVGRSVEGPQGTLAPNDSITVDFEVHFPCFTRVGVTAEADCFLSVIGNLRTSPQLTVAIPPVHLVPWLATQVKVGQPDSSGIITWNPSQLCPDLEVVAQVSVTNVGCADAPTSDTKLTVTSGVVQVSKKSWTTPKIPAGTTLSLPYHSFNLPAPPPGQITVEACADTGGVVTGQCDTAHLCASTSAWVSQKGTGAPALSLAVKGNVFPGEVPVVTWSILNDCTDLGKVTGEILHGTDRVHPAPGPLAEFPILPLGEAGEEDVNLTVQPSVAPSLWSVAPHTLELRVTGKGAVTTTFTAKDVFDVVLETPHFAFAWAVSAAPSWKKVYSVGGTMINSADFSSMTVSAITITESTTTLGVTAAGAIAVAAPAAPIPSKGGTAPLSIPSRVQSWNWINPTTFHLSGPTSATFRYALTFTLTDEFGNVYPPPVSPQATTVTVTVPAGKLQLQSQAATELAAAIAAMVVGGPAQLVAIVLWGFAIWHKAKADDPPAPDFRYDERVEVAPGPVEIPPDAGVWAAPLTVALEVLERFRAAHEAMTLIEPKIIGARIDGAAEALARQLDDYRAALARLQAAAAEAPNAAALAAEAMSADERWQAQQLADGLEQWRSGRVSEEARRAWLEAGLPEVAFEDLSGRLPAFEELAPVPEALVRIADQTVTLAGELAAEGSEVLAETPS